MGAEYLWLGRLAPWSWSWAPASWAPASWATWWKQLVRKRRGGRKGAESEEGSRVPVAWRLGPSPGLLPPGLLPPALLGGRRKQLVRKLRGGRKGAESEEGSRVPVAWRLSPGPRLLPPGLLGGRLEAAAGQVRRAAANLQVLRRRQASGAPPPPTFRCAAALSPFSLLSLSES